MDRHYYRGEGEDRDREPLFRSDLEERPEPPRYEPIRPQGAVWSTIKRLAVPLVGIGLLLAKFKSVLLLLLKVKFVGTALTMLLSIGAYALWFPVWFSVGIVVLIWVHEMGHVLQLKREGIKASAPMFIPLLGAFVAMKEMPKNALVEARVGLAGPVLGTLGSLGTLGIYAATQNPLFLGLSFSNSFINLFNMVPILPLDGGRAAGAMAPAFWLLGAGLVAALLLVTPFNPFLILILAYIAYLGGAETWRRWKRRNTPEGQAYNDIELRHRVIVGVVYFVLIAVLGLLMAITHVPDPAATFAGDSATPFNRA
jgi:Zn-dependent protease